MTDVSAPIGGGTPSKEGPISRFAHWLFFRRQGLLSVWIALALCALAAVAYWHSQREPILETAEAQILLAASAVVLLGLPLLLLLLDPPDNYLSGPRPGLPLVTLLLLSGIAAFVVADHYAGWQFISSDNSELNQAIRLALLCVFLVAFIPRIWNASNFARFELERRDEKAKSARQSYIQEYRRRHPTAEQTIDEEKNEEDGDAASIGALVATIFVVFIGTLAFFAGNGASLSLRSGFGFGLCFFVIGLFVVVVLVDLFSELAFVRYLARASEGLAKLSHPLAAFYNWIDAGLVQIGAAVAGMGHRDPVFRYVILLGTLAALCIAGLYLPAPYGLLPACVGFVLAMSVSRLWNWVEDDRALAALTKYKATAPYRTDFREDYKDETLLGFAFVFMFAPIAMMQANDGGVFGEHLFNNADGRHLGDWIGFFGIELAKAIPVVDWAEIYGVQTNSDMIAINGPASRHAVFLARVMVDLVLIAALLQFVGVWTRNRQQKQLYAAGHIDRLDPFVERIELARAMRASRIGEQSFDFSRLRARDLVDFRRYNEDQLKVIFGSTSESTTRSFVQKIANQRGMHLGSAIDLTIEIAESHGNEVDLISAFNRAKYEHHETSYKTEPDDLFRILTALRSKTGLRDFKRSVVQMLEQIATPVQVIELLSGLAEGEKADHFQYARRDMAMAIERAKSRPQ